MKRSNKKLLLAAVLLFSLSWTIVSPLKGAEKIIFCRPVIENESIIVEQVQEEFMAIPENYLLSQSQLMANALASLNIQTENRSDSEEEAYENEEYLSTAAQQSALVAQTMPVTLISQKPRDEVISYIVQTGDVPSSIAASFGISLNTLLWANKLNSSSLIRPGDELIILPVTGVLHRVKNNETIQSIAKLYKAGADEIIAFNDLSADGIVQIGQKLVIPDGQMPTPVAAKPVKIASRTSTTGPGTGVSHSFPYGQCTWYVAQKRVVTWSGNAKDWLTNARAAGYQTGSSAQTGAIMVMTDGGWLGRRYGHVGYVEAVNGQWVTISEMNYNCYACKSVRTLKADDWRIKGYIY